MRTIAITGTGGVTYATWKSDDVDMINWNGSVGGQSLGSPADGDTDTTRSSGASTGDEERSAWSRTRTRAVDV